MGEYEPRDSRNITGTASTPDGRWTNEDGKTPLAAGAHVPVKKGDHQMNPRADSRAEGSKGTTQADRDAEDLAVRTPGGD